MRNRWLALLLSPIGLLLLSAFRLLVISDYNTTTATTIAESGGYFNTLLGSIIPLLPIFIPYIALILLLFEQFALSIIAFIFTVFMAPTPLKLPVTVRAAHADEHQLFMVDGNMNDRVLTVAIFAVLLLIAWSYHKSFVEGLSTVVVVIVALALVAAPYVVNLRLPDTLRAAFRDEHQIVIWVAHNQWLALLFALAIFVVAVSYRPDLRAGLFATVAVAATVAVFPYVYNIYHFPRHPGYYESVLHQPWLQAQKITLTSGHVYHGYVLSTADYWFTVLLVHRRTVVYIRDQAVASRTVCRPKQSGGRKQYPPLIPIFYTPPPHIRSCASR